MLLPGTYDLTTSIYDHTIVHPFDFRQKVLRFQVDPGTPTRELRRGDVARRALERRSERRSR